MTYKLNLIIILLSTALLNASCGSGSSSAARDPVPGAVNQLEFDGDPGKFAGRYTGTCVVQAADRSYTSCSARINVKQDDSHISVLTLLCLISSDHPGSGPKCDGGMYDHLIVRGKQLTDAHGVSGVIGAEGFSYVLSGNAYRFARLYLNNYVYSSTFMDASGRTVSVTARVQRGSLFEPSEYRMNDSNRAK